MAKIVQAYDYLSSPANALQEARALLEGLDYDLRQALTGGVGGAVIGLGQDVMERVLDFLGRGMVVEARAEYLGRVQALSDLIDQSFDGDPVADLATTTSVGVIVNVYGSRDILSLLKVDGTGIGGYREDVGGFTMNSTISGKRLINIEIVGASHFDYMRREGTLDTLVNRLSPAEKEWNETVSDFVARLASRTQNADAVTTFMLSPDIAPYVERGLGDNHWIVKLPGWATR